jgi:hypothetical protein
MIVVNPFDLHFQKGLLIKTLPLICDGEMIFSMRFPKMEGC